MTPITQIPNWIINLVAFSQLVFALAVGIIALCFVALLKHIIALIKGLDAAVENLNEHVPRMARGLSDSNIPWSK